MHKTTRFTFKVLILFLFILSTRKKQIHSHPHVFITYKTQISFKDNALKSIRVIWLFDRFFSNMILSQYDRNRDKKISKNENALVKRKAFDNLKHYGYFTYIKINNKKRRIRKVRDFAVNIIKTKIMYAFTVDLNVKIKTKIQKLSVTYHDPTIYVAFGPNKKAVSLLGADKVNVKIMKRRNTRLIMFRSK